jgi:hypothetical protein
MLCAEGQRTTCREQDGQDILETIEPLAEAQNIFAAREAIERGEWVDLGVIADGTRFIIRINGATVIDTRDEHPTKFISRGMMGLEYSHRRGTNDAVEFKEILFRRLPSSTKPSNRSQLDREKLHQVSIGIAHKNLHGTVRASHGTAHDYPQRLQMLAPRLQIFHPKRKMIPTRLIPWHPPPAFRR